MPDRYGVLGFVCVALFAAASMAGCCGSGVEFMGSAEAMGSIADDRVSVLQDCDREGFDALAASGLEKAIDEAEFKHICTTLGGLGGLGGLGAFKSKAQTTYGFHNAVLQATYNMEFASGPWTLELHTESFEIVKFNFTKVNKVKINKDIETTKGAESKTEPKSPHIPEFDDGDKR